MREKATIVDYDEYSKEEIIPGHGTRKSDFKWHILAEGDSWFHFNRAGPQENLLQHLEFDQRSVIVNVAMSADTIQEMVENGRSEIFKKAIKNNKWNLILFSGGGNDLIDAFCGGYEVDGKSIRILKSAHSMRFMDYIDEDALLALLDSIKSYYGEIIKWKNTLGKGQNKDAKILIHCYDFFTFRNNLESDSRRYRALLKYGAEPKLWPSISDYLVQKLGDTLLLLHDPSQNFYVVDTRGTLVRADLLVLGNSNDWRNEIHPNHGGYEKLAKLCMNDKINKLPLGT